MLSLNDCLRAGRSCISNSQITWSSTGTLVAIVAEDSFYILKFDRSAYDSRLEGAEEITDEGVEEAFDVTAEIPDKSVLNRSPSMDPP